jgi:hypothetical protein
VGDIQLFCFDVLFENTVKLMKIMPWHQLNNRLSQSELRHEAGKDQLILQQRYCDNDIVG